MMCCGILACCSLTCGERDCEEEAQGDQGAVGGGAQRAQHVRRCAGGGAVVRCGGVVVWWCG